jgi:hypothetical protein
LATRKQQADDEFGEWILDGHGILPRSYLPSHPEKVQPGMNTDERQYCPVKK